MFKSKCIKCNRKVDKKYDFCPFCGSSLKTSEEDFGFFGKGDFEDNFKLPFGFKIMLKPLMKELSRQMNELDKEMKKGDKMPRGNFTSFTIRIDTPGNKPVRIENIPNSVNMDSAVIENSKPFELPKIESELLNKSRDFERKEAETNIRRLSDKVVYEFFLPGVKSLKKVNMTLLENGISIKALGDKTIYFKDLNVNFPLINYYLKDEKFFVEFALR